ncbi:hypothetical protein [Roseicella aerolata]|uniref:Uncharacterized protein n=1 Tax=Roseicella aerolata TaxID=2883479 RepID=A0A9X1I914_9PROT|nr:hypothetical protein [Roseicella aerolata]MCB4820476.1 hypothetical protein [Roseicella aerolata]
MHARPGPSRRDWLRAGLGAGAGLVLTGPARAMLPPSATLLVPGPEGGAFARLAERLAGSLARGATTALRLSHSVLGGPDGVTAANRFATAGAPDGKTLLLLPGAAALARLIGDPRARFDPTGWLAVCAVQGTAVVAGRDALPPPGSAPRFALGGPDMPDAAALLGLDLLGLQASPVLGLPPPRAEAALAQGRAEAAVLQGADVPARLQAIGARPWFTLDPAGIRDPALPEVPALADLTGWGSPELRGAFAAAAACLRLPAALVLPALTPADVVAAWRGAAQRWLEEEARQGWAPGLRALPGAEAASLVAAIAPPPAAALAYREWLLRRLNWRAD